MRDCQARINRLYEIVRQCTNPVSAVKAAAELSGRGSRWLRQKSLSATEEQMAGIDKILRECDAGQSGW